MSTFWPFFGIFRILTSNGTRKALRSKEKLKQCKMGHPTERRSFISTDVAREQSGDLNKGFSEWPSIDPLMA